MPAVIATGSGGGLDGTGNGVTVTSGDTGVTDGSGLPTRLLLVTVTTVTLGFAVVNALTVGDDLRDAGQRVAAWEPWVWELTSAAFWIAAAIPLVALTRRLRPPAVALGVALLGVVALSLPVCGVHVLWLAGTRALAYAALSETHHYDCSWSHLVYEWRKDLLSVLVFAGLGAGLDRWFQPAAAHAPPPPAFRLEVRDGTRRHWLAPREIERIEAAGNYVELYTGDARLLHRATLNAVETQLAEHGFVRIHRSRLVRRDAVKTLATTPSGDFEATLLSEAVVAGSRRFRAELALSSPMELSGVVPYQPPRGRR